MINELLFAVTLMSALGCALMGGVFFAFSAFVMKALDCLPPAQSIAAMQAINVAVMNPWFLGPFFGTAVACLVLAVSALLRPHTPGAVCLLVGSLLYLIGTMLVTVVFNVPRNNALAAVEPAHADGASRWADYLTSWTAWNHVRTVAALAAAASLTLTLWLPRDGVAA